MYGMINMEAIPKFDIKSVIKSDIKFDISTKLTTWIGHQGVKTVHEGEGGVKKWQNSVHVVVECLLMANGFSAMFTLQPENTKRYTLLAPHCCNGSCRYVRAEPHPIQ